MDNKSILIPIILRLFINSKLFPNRRDVAIKALGFKVHGPNYYTILFLFKEVFLEQQYYFESHKMNPTIIDCGSNIGMSMLYFKWLFPNATIICFEPQRRAFDFLKLNFEKNKLSGVSIHNTALMDYNGVTLFNEPSSGVGLMASLYSSRESHGREITVPCVKLSDFITNHPIDLIKVDVEGAEGLILRDLVAENKLYASQIILEYHHGIKEMPLTLSQFLAIMEEQGYSYNINANFNRPGDYQDLTFYFKRLDL